MKNFFYIALFLTLLTVNACSNKKTDQSPGTTGNTEAAKSNPLAERWIAVMKEGLPEALCKDSMYFRQCFQVTQEECLTQSKNSFDKCLPNFKNDILKNFGSRGDASLSADGAEWGAKIGECTGVDYETTLISKRINSDKCKDPKNWIDN